MTRAFSPLIYMEIIFGIEKIKKFKKPVVALGVFDGMHRGHRFILRQTLKKAQEIGGTSIAVTFYPHPQAQKSLYSLKHRLTLIDEIGIDVCIVMKFDRAFSRIPAAEFIKNILVGKIGARVIYVGKNFRFGKSAEGDCRLLNKTAKVFGYTFKSFDVIRTKHFPVSSTYIRKLITQGNLSAAEKLLSRPVAVFGTVIKGISLARKFGFPTANIDPHHEILPPSGVYAVRIILGPNIYNGVCNIGTKPTLVTKPEELGSAPQKHIEAYIFDFNKNIYGKDLEIQFIKKLRNELKFHSLELLAKQIKKDIAAAKKILYRRKF